MRVNGICFKPESLDQIEMKWKQVLFRSNTKHSPPPRISNSPHTWLQILGMFDARVWEVVECRPQRDGLGFRVGTHIGFPASRCTFLGGPHNHNQDCSILGSILGSPSETTVSC